MGIYIFNWDMLKKYLTEDEADPNSRERLWQERHPQPAERRPPYVCLSFQRLLEGCRHHLQPCGRPTWRSWTPSHSGINLFDENWKIYSRNSGKPCQQIGSDATIVNSMISEGCQSQRHGQQLHPLPGRCLSRRVLAVEAAVDYGRHRHQGGRFRSRHCIVAENVIG